MWQITVTIADDYDAKGRMTLNLAQDFAFPEVVAWMEDLVQRLDAVIEGAIVGVSVSRSLAPPDLPASDGSNVKKGLRITYESIGGKFNHVLPTFDESLTRYSSQLEMRLPDWNDHDLEHFRAVMLFARDELFGGHPYTACDARGSELDRTTAGSHFQWKGKKVKNSRKGAR